MFTYAGGLTSLNWGVLPDTSPAVQITRVMADKKTATTLSGGSSTSLEDSSLLTDKDSLAAT